MLFRIYPLKQAYQSLKHRPGFVTTVVATMGVSLGALACVLTLAYLLIVQPLPYPEQERIYHVDYTKKNELGVQLRRMYSFPSLLHMYKDHDVFEQSAMVYYTKNVLTTLPSQPTVPAAFISPEYFSLFNVPMALGRPFDHREALDSEHQVAIISYDTWQRYYHGDANILTKTLDFKGRSYRIVGVTGKSFVEPQIYRQGINTQLWLPWDLHLNPKSEQKWDWSYNILYFFAKLPKGVSAEQAQQQLTSMMDDLWRAYTEAQGVERLWFVEIELTRLSEKLLGDNKRVVYLLVLGILGLVLIAGTNISNLFVSRTAEQQANLAIYAALGAKKSHLFTIVLAETSLLMFASLVLALLIASAGFFYMQTYFVELMPRVAELKVNGITVICALIFAAVASVFFALICRRMIHYRRLNKQLQSSGKGTGIQVAKGMRQALIVSQVAIATILVFANISLFKSAVNEINRPTGLNLNNLYHTSFSVAAPVYPAGDVVLPIMTELKQQLLLLPQVEQVDLSFSSLADTDSKTLMNPQTNEEVQMHVRGVGNLYFDMTGHTFLQGGMFTKADYLEVDDSKAENSESAETEKSATPVIINQALAAELFPEGSAADQTITLGDDLLRIVGVVSNTFMPGTTKLTNQMYYPISPAATKMNIRVKPNHSLSREEVVEAVKATTSLYSLFGLERLTDRQAALLYNQYATAITTAALALITIVLATIGLYGILSYGTQMRRFELGTRMAVGAKKRDLIWLIIRENSATIFVGMVISAVTLMVLYTGFSAELNHYIHYSLVTWYALTLLVISVLSLFACYWPLRQYINQPAIYSLRGAD